MTAPEEEEEGAALIGVTGLIEVAEIEPVAIEGSHLVRVPCGAGCGETTVMAPGRRADALCGGCRRVRADASAKISGLPRVAPPSLVGASEIAPRPVACPVCRVTKINRACKFAGYVPLVPPELVCGPGCDHDEPDPVTTLHAEAIDAGWYAEIHHSRGTRAGARTVTEEWSVRFRRGPRQGYAVRSGETWKSVCVTGAKLSPFLALGVTELRQWLADPEQPASWYAEIRERVAAQALASKQRACPGPGECVLELVALAFVPLGVPVVKVDHTHRANGDIKIKKTRKEAVSGA